MAMNRRATNDDVVERLEKQMIIQLGLVGVRQRSIREIVECDMNRVTKILKHLKPRAVKGEV